MSLVESLIAVVVLSIGMLGLVFATTAGHQHLDASEERLRAIRLAEHLLEEIQARPYSGLGIDRLTYCLDDYDGFSETPGQLQRVPGGLYDDIDQAFSREVSVTPDNLTVTAWESAVVPGKTVTVTVTAPSGASWSLIRFIAEPSTP